MGTMKWTEVTQGKWKEIGDIINLLCASLVWAMVESWSFAYFCFSFNGNDMTPTVEEYTTLLNIPKIEVENITLNRLV
ncbi:hypothetical protein GQ457_11G023470 [Hibiscus cannabinus]